MKLHFFSLLLTLTLFTPPGFAERPDLRSTWRDLRGRQAAVMNTYASEAAEAVTNVYQFGVVGGTAVTAGGYVRRVVRWYQKRGVAVDARDVATFFTLSEPERRSVAAAHPQFAKVLAAVAAEIGIAD